MFHIPNPVAYFIRHCLMLQSSSNRPLLIHRALAARGNRIKFYIIVTGERLRLSWQWCYISFLFHTRYYFNLFISDGRLHFCFRFERCARSIDRPQELNILSGYLSHVKMVPIFYEMLICFYVTVDVNKSKIFVVGTTLIMILYSFIPFLDNFLQFFYYSNHYFSRVHCTPRSLQ